LSLESYVEAVSARNKLAKSSPLHYPSTPYQICGFDSSFAFDGWTAISEFVDEIPESICLAQRKCAKHDRWELLRIGEVETEMVLSLQKASKLKNELRLLDESLAEIASHIHELHGRAEKRLLCV
jgi:hypothetical protein